MLYRFISLFVSRLKLPWLFTASVIALLLNFILPDPIPFLDEILMALVTAVLASIRKPHNNNTPTADD